MLIVVMHTSERLVGKREAVYSMYSGTSIIRTPLDTALMLAYRISEIVRITEVLTFLTEFMVPTIVFE